jgi:hypothetical protein
VETPPFERQPASSRLPPHLRLTYQGRLVDCSDSSNVHTESPSKATSLIKKDSMSKTMGKSLAAA